MENEQQSKDLTPDVNMTEVKVDSSISEDLTIAVSEVQYISEKGVPPSADPSLVKVRISYPKDYEGPKHMKDGEVKEVSKEVAQLFIDRKIAKLVK